MNIAITGTEGFIGREVLKYFKMFGHKTYEVDNAPVVKPDYYSRHTFLETIEGDDGEIELDAIIHMGACTDTLCQDREYLQAVNTDYSKRLWGYCAQKQIKFIYASSAATYGDGSLGFKDDYETAKNAVPLNPYGDSKKNFDIWAIEKAAKNFAPSSWAGLKFFNVYGPDEGHKKKMASMVYQAIWQAKTWKMIRLFKDGEQKRDFVFVGDVVRVIDFLLDKTPCGFVNVGTGKSRSFNDLANAVFSALKMEKKIEYFDMPEELKPAYQNNTQADIEKLKYYFEYHREFTTLEDGVKLTAASIIL